MASGNDNNPHDVPNYAPGANPKPTRAPLQDRQATPDKYNTSGMESALGALADKTHKRK